MTTSQRDVQVWCNLCSSTIKSERYKCMCGATYAGLTCPDWDCCESCEASASVRHPGHKLMHVLPENDMPKNPHPDPWYMHANPECSNVIEGPRFKCTLCADYDLCASCEAEPHAMHQAQFGLAHLFVKIPQPLNPREWAHTVFGQAFVCQEQSAPRAPPTGQTRTAGVDIPVPDVSDIGMVPEVEEPETALVVPEDIETDGFPPLPEDPFSGTGTRPFDFVAGIRAASQLVGLGRDVLNHPYLQQAAPPLKHVAAFMSALHTPSDAKGMPKVDISQFFRATEQLFDAILSAKQTKTPTQNDIEEMLSQTHQASADEDPEPVTVTEDKEDYYTPVMKSTSNTSESLYASPLGQALATNFQTLLNEQAAQSAS